jgi:two-component system, LytTR family, response regulator
MKTAVIIEDMHQSEKVLQRLILRSNALLPEHQQINVVTTLLQSDIGSDEKFFWKKSARIISSVQPSLVFLDLNLETYGDGLNILQEFPVRFFDVICLTGYTNLALLATSYRLPHILHKPLSWEQLHIVLADVHNRRSDAEVLMQISSQNVRRLFNYDVNQLLYLEAHRQYTELHNVRGDTETFSYNLGYYEQQLNPHIFLRVHKSYIVNLAFVRSVRKFGQELEMINGTYIPISAERKKHVIAALNNNVTKPIFPHATTLLQQFWRK